MRTLRTFTEFVEHASSVFKLSMSDAEVKILNVLNEKRVSTRSVVAYINWTYYDPMSKAEIAVAMNTSVSTVDNWLRRLKKVWPVLFRLAPRLLIGDKGPLRVSLEHRKMAAPVHPARGPRCRAGDRGTWDLKGEAGEQGTWDEPIQPDDVFLLGGLYSG